jgi:hypothetical protein
MSRGRRSRSYTRDAQELQATADDLFEVIGSGVVKITVNQRFKLAEAATGARSAAFSQYHRRDNLDSVKPITPRRSRLRACRSNVLAASARD